MRNLLKSTVNNLDVDKTKLKIVLTGHSLGGALSTLAACDLINNTEFLSELGIGADQIYLMTFCSPRVLSKEAYQYIETEQKDFMNRAIRFWRHRDIVAAIPTGYSGYRHVGQSWCLMKVPDNVGKVARWMDPFSHHYMKDILDDITKFVEDPQKVTVCHVIDGVSPRTQGFDMEDVSSEAAAAI